jgi:hypothetical protein
LTRNHGVQHSWVLDRHGLVLIWSDRRVKRPKERGRQVLVDERISLVGSATGLRGSSSSHIWFKFLTERLPKRDDVALTSPADGEALVFNGSNFINQKVFHVHDEAVAATAWTVVHNIGQQYCNVVIVDDQDEVIIPESIKFDSENQLTVTFNTAVAGKVVVAGVA